MRKLIGTFLVMAFFGHIGILRSQQITIDPLTRYQEWIGIGGTVYTNQSWGTAVYNELINDIGYSVFRKHLEPKKQEVHADEALVAQSIADANNTDIYHIISLWSPDPEFKIGPYNNGCLESDGRYCGGKLDPTKYHEFADWFCDQVQYYINRGVNVYAVSLQNEPWLSTNYLSCTYTPTEYVNMFKVVAPIVKSRFPDIKLYGAEQAFAIGNANNRIAAKLAQDASESYMDAYAYHGSFPGSFWSQYTDEVSPIPGGPMSNAHLERYAATLPDQKGHKSQWQTEKNHVSDWLAKGDLNEWTWSNSTRTFQEASCIMAFIRDMHGEVWTQYRFDEVTDVPSRKAAWTHYGKYIEPGSRVIASGHDVSRDVSSVAFHDEAKNRLTVVLIKGSSGTATIKLTDSNISSQGTWYMSDKNNLWVNKGSVFEGQNITLNGYSISTIVFNNYNPDISSAVYPLGGGGPEIIPVTGVTIDNCSSSEIEVGNTYDLNATVSPSNATNKTKTWESLNTSVATVDPNNGIVTAVSSGFAVIKVTTQDGSHADQCTINVATQPCTDCAGGNYRYLRFETDNIDADRLRISEIEYKAGTSYYPAQNMTSENTPSPLVVTSSHDGWQNPWKLYDGITNSEAFNIGTTSYWNVIDLGAGNEISPSEVKITAGSVNGKYPIDFIIKGSENGTTWDNLVIVTGESNWTAYSTHTFTLSGGTTTPTYDLTINVTGSGSVNPSAGVHTYDEGTVVTISPTPAEGWQLSNSVPSNVTMNSDFTVDVIFEEIPEQPAAFRYFKFNATSIDGDRIRLSELKYIAGGTEYPTANMTSENTPSPLVVTSSHDGWQNPWMLYDGVENSEAFNIGTASYWNTIDLGEGNEISATQVVFVSGSKTGKNPVDFTIEGSLDGNSWTNLLTVQGQPQWSVYSDYSFNLSAAKSAKTVANTSSLLNVTPATEPMLNVFPNPAEKGQFTVLFENMNEQTIYLKLIDVSGKTVFRQTQVISGSDQLHIDQLKPGFYHLMIQSADVNKVQKVIVK